MLTQTQRRTMAADIISAMRTSYEQDGEEEGDFDDGYRYLSNDASDSELQYEHDKWCKV